MALYKQIEAETLLIDDRRARRVADANGIRCQGALGVLIYAKKVGKLDLIRDRIEILRESSLHYSDSILDTALQLAGE